jgi:hypothetical protein
MQSVKVTLSDNLSYCKLSYLTQLLQDSCRNINSLFHVIPSQIVIHGDTHDIQNYCRAQYQLTVQI